MTETQLRGTALALRDLAETAGLTEISGTFADGTVVTVSPEDGCHLLTNQQGVVDLTEWIDQPELWPSEGVESVREQFVTRAAAAPLERE